MGCNFKEELAIIQSCLSDYAIKPKAIYAFGSSILNMTNELSDKDFLIVTKSRVPLDLKTHLMNSLEDYSQIETLFFSEEALALPLPHLFIETASIQSAIYFGLKVYGDYAPQRAFNLKRFVNCRAYKALFVLHYLKHGTPACMNSAKKQFFRAILLVWWREGKIGIKSLISPQHFFLEHVSTGFKAFRRDGLFHFLDEFGSLWDWLDGSLSKDPSVSDLQKLAYLIKQRLKGGVLPSALELLNDVYHPEFHELQCRHAFSSNFRWIHERNQGFRLANSSKELALLEVFFLRNPSLC